MIEDQSPASGPAPQRIECHISLDASGEPAVSQLARQSGLSKQALKNAMSKGAVWVVQGKRVRRWRRIDKTFPAGTKIHLYYDRHILALIPPSPTLIADERAYSVWFKPYGLCSQGSRWGDHFAIDRWIAQHTRPQRPALVVHRLDRAARGLILIAHTKTCAAALSRLFQTRAIDKRYQAIVHGAFPSGPSTRIDQAIDGRSAISHITLAHHINDKHLSALEIAIETGRKHQIRRHLADLGYPIAGDRLYGGATAASDETTQPDLQLCAFQLALFCPIDQREKHFILPTRLRLF